MTKDEKIAALQMALDRANEKFLYLGFPNYTYDLDYGTRMIEIIVESRVADNCLKLVDLLKCHFDDSNTWDKKEVIKVIEDFWQNDG